MTVSIRRSLLLGGALVSLGFPRLARAQPSTRPGAGEAGWAPSRPVRIVVPFPPGGSADVQARMIAQHLSPALGQPVVIENRPGAGGSIGAVEVARSAPDGHTLFMATTGTQSANQFLYSNLAYDPEKDLAPISLVTYYPQAVVAGAWLQDRSLPGLVAALKAMPQPATYGSSGSGSPTHLAGALFARSTGVTLTHVPYRGQGPALNDLTAGLIQLMFPSVADVLGQLRGGPLSAVAVMNPTRMSVVPEVPTTAEGGYPGLDSAIWAGLYTRAGTPRPAVARLNTEVVRILAMPEVRDRLVAAGFEVRPGTPEALGNFQAEESRRWGALIRETGARAD
jgi:tripartite-type tricarboxylate transporter receptor subunit TctC